MSVTATLYAAAAAGAAIGLRHSFEPDHFAAIATLVDDDRAETRKAGYVGAWWGAGHSAPIVLGALLLVALGVRIPQTTEVFFEVIAGLILVALGVRTLLDIGGYVRHSHSHGSQSHSHAHDDGEHDHSHDGEGHGHLKIGSLLLGGKHSHYKEESFVVGVLHGFAGTGILVVLVTAAAPTAQVALGFVGAFAAVTVVSMAVIAVVWGRLISFEKAGERLRLFGGVLAVGVGLLLVATGAGLADVQTHTHGDVAIVDHELDVAEFEALNDEGEVVADAHAGHWHGSLPDIERDGYVAVGARVEVSDGGTFVVGKEAGEGGAYRLEGSVFEDAPELVETESHGDQVRLHGEEEGLTEVFFEVTDTEGDVVYESPPVTVQVTE